MAFPAGWTSKAQITLYASKVDVSTTDIPTLITHQHLIANCPEIFDADGTHPALNGGGDIRLALDSDGATQLPIDLVGFVTDNTPANGKAKIWTKLDRDSAVDDTIWIFWGKSDATQDARDSTYGAENVWTSDFSRVWHLNEGQTTATGGYKEMTSNAAHATGTSMSDATGTDPWGFDCAAFDEVDDQILGPAITIAEPFTLMCLLRSPDVGKSKEETALSVGDSSSSYNTGVGYIISNPVVSGRGPNYFKIENAAVTLAIDTWVFVASRSISDTSRYVYCNKTISPEDIEAASINYNRSAIGRPAGNVREHAFDGQICEAFIRNVDTPQTWLDILHENLISTSSFAVSGARQDHGMHVYEASAGSLVFSGISADHELGGVSYETGGIIPTDVWIF